MLIVEANPILWEIFYSWESMDLTAGLRQLALPEMILSPIEGSRLHLARFSSEAEEIDSLYGMLSDPRLWADGYDLSGRIIDISNRESLWRMMEELWLADELELMVAIFDGAFVGITGVVDRDIQRDEALAPWRVVTGRTVLSPDLWGTSTNAEIKLMLYDTIFEQGVDTVESTVSCTNLRSLAAMEKFGFRILNRSSKLVDGEPKEFVRFGISSADWPELRAQNLSRALAGRNNHGEQQRQHQRSPVEIL